MNSFAKSLDDPRSWRGITDQVMGGKSDLIIDYSDGIFTMKGIVTTENNGGFVKGPATYRLSPAKFTPGAQVALGTDGMRFTN